MSPARDGRTVLSSLTGLEYSYVTNSPALKHWAIVRRQRAFGAEEWPGFRSSWKGLARQGTKDDISVSWLRALCDLCVRFLSRVDTTRRFEVVDFAKQIPLHRSATTSSMRDATSGSTESRPTKRLNMPE